MQSCINLSQVDIRFFECSANVRLGAIVMCSVDVAPTQLQPLVHSFDHRASGQGATVSAKGLWVVVAIAFEGTNMNKGLGDLSQITWKSNV